MSSAQVLIVEDEVVVARDLQQRLINMEYTVCGVALSGAEAISMATEMRPNIILMDIKLGKDMDGIEAASRIRNHLDIPVIYLTAYSDQDTLQRAKVSEPFGYLLKPYRTRELQTSIEMVLHKHKLECQVREAAQLHQILLDSMPCAAFLLRTGSREIVASNKFAVEAGAVPGKTCFGTWGQRDDPCPWCLAPSLWASGQPQHLEVDALGVVWDAHWIPVSEDLYMHYAFDITERKRTEEQLRKYRQQLRALASKFDQAEEKGRRRMGAFLHDYVGHGLALVKTRLAALKEKAPSAELGGALEQIGESIASMMRHTQSLVEDLNPAMRLQKGFEAAAEWLTRYELGFENAPEWLSERGRAKHDFVTSFEDDGKHKPLDQEVSSALFRSLRELLVNVAKHAQAKNAKVCVRRAGANIEIQVQDDGVGFDPGKVQSREDLGAGFGFFGVEERLKHFGGRLQLQSEPGQGTRVTLTAPLKLDAEVD